jgi:glycosyltransferase involved in cell wall biosynthesis
MSKVFAIAMVKDEEDIIKYTIEHLLCEDIDNFIILDNMSSDGTRDILEDLAKEYKNILIEDDFEVAYYQSLKMTNLANKAVSNGADWIVPFDADEVWYAASGNTLGSELRALREPIAMARVFDHFPSPNDPPHDNPIKSIVHKEPFPELWPCVAFRNEEGFKILQGNHNVIRSGERNLSAIEIRHFQYRSFEQFKKKLRNGKTAYDATDLPEGEGAHWRQMGALDDQSLLQLWKDFLSTDMILDPAPTRS